MADCGSIDDARQAAECETDVLSTTLAGYTGERIKTDGPDMDLLAQMVGEFPNIPIICEGRVHTPAQASAVMKKGAWAAVVGTAITHPTTITSWFSQAIKNAE